MKITKLETLCLSRLHEVERQWFTSRFRTIKADCAIVVIHTDEGVTGIGEASAYGWPLLIREWVDFLAPDLIGKDPTDPTLAPHPNGRARPHDAAIAGIDCALWDLRAKSQGLSVAKLINSQAADQVRLYASSGCRYDWRERPEQLIDEALEYIDQGYSALKFRPGTDWNWDGITIDHFLGFVRELAQAVDGRMELMLDGGLRWSEDEAMTIAKELDRLDFAWFEEPIARENIDGYARLCAAVEMPISGGETFHTVEQFRPYLEKKAYDIVQPDAGICGITELLRIAEVADRHGVDLIPHSWHNGLMCMAHAHAIAALPLQHRAKGDASRHHNLVELCLIQGPLQWEILANPPAIVDGWLHLPDQPGLGVELGADLAERFPYIEGHYAISLER
jgi:L-alanine-DL-glutamate epimerase-like enolase superfamily enzyme